jgi:hypothetical protein
MAEEKKYGSPAIAKEVERIYGKKAKPVEIEMKYEDEVAEYLRIIENGHEKAAESRLVFK